MPTRARRAAAILGAVLALAGCTASTPGPSASPTQRARTVDPARLAEVLAQADLATYKVTYAVNGRLSKNAVAGRWITYQRPPIVRVDALLSSGRDSEAATTYTFADSAVVCALGPQPPCEAMSRAEAEALGFFTQPLDAPFRADPTTFDLAQNFEERIAGEAVTCFVVEPKPAARTAYVGFEACYTKDGIPMRIRMELKEGEIELEGQLLLRDFPEVDVVPPR